MDQHKSPYNKFLSRCNHYPNYTVQVFLASMVLVIDKIMNELVLVSALNIFACDLIRNALVLLYLK